MKVYMICCDDYASSFYIVLCNEVLFFSYEEVRKSIYYNLGSISEKELVDENI